MNYVSPGESKFVNRPFEFGLDRLNAATMQVENSFYSKNLQDRDNYDVTIKGRTAWT
ncbi:hypothetical protein D9M70_513470 [compost metagenome]